MRIIKLKNPKTKLYTEIKNHILGNSNLGREPFSWQYSKTTTIEEDKNICNPPMYSHVFLGRSEHLNLYTRTYSEVYMENINQMYCEILNTNIDIMKGFNMMCRCAANAVEPYQKKNIITQPHVDHNFPHKNMLIYLTDAGGSTFVEGEEFAPEEDDVIIFEGIHWHELPKEKRRVVLVMTYI